MRFIEKIFKRNKTSGGGGIEIFHFNSGARLPDMQLAAVYRCVQVISDGVATLPLEIFIKNKDGYLALINNNLSVILGRIPNEKMTRYTLLKLWVQSLLLKGNAYGRIVRNGSQVVAIDYISESDVKILETVNGDIVYRIKGKIVDNSEIIHILNNSDNGIIGKSTISYAASTLNIASYATNQASNFFESGGAVNGVISSKSILSTKQKEEIAATWRKTYGAGSVGNSNIAVLGADVEYRRISINPADSQLLESRQFEVVEISRFFGVSPTKLFDLTKSNYATYEAGQLAFLNETLAPLLTKIELELWRKLFLPMEQPIYEIKFNTKAILRADLSKTASYFSQMLNIGGMSINEIRYELGMPSVGGGDTILIQTNLTTLDKLKNITNE